jgi:hypothetical protein
MSAEVKREVDDAEHMARQSPVPSAQWAFTDVDTWQAAEGVVA